LPKSDSPAQQRASAAPRPIPVTTVQIAAIAAAHGVPNGPFEPIDSIGIINSVYKLGERFVLRVPRDHPGHLAQARREACAIPAAVDAGVRTPALVAFDDTLEILPVPFLIVERVDGASAESLGTVPPHPRAAWRRLGADLGRLHLSTTPPPPGDPWPDETRDPRELVELRAAEGWISPLEARRFGEWLDRLAPLVGAPARVFLHGDLQMSNVLLDRGTQAYLSLIDWGGARGGNAADDFSVVPLAAVGPMLEGYREHQPAEPVVTEALILWRRLQLILRLLPRGPVPGWAWGERPVARLVDMLLYFNELTDSPWRDLGPHHRGQRSL
jgi:hygromycin-B 7''-O-kinase